MRLTVTSQEVLYAEGPVVKMNSGDVRQLDAFSRETKRQRARICTHKGVEDTLHEMFIVHARGAYVRPHKHLNKSESLHILEGRADLVLFNEEGGVVDRTPLGDYSSGLHFYCRINEPFFHTLLIRSETLVFHEVTNGPFDRGDTVFAPWAPGDADEEAVRMYLEQLSLRSQGEVLGRCGA